MKHLLLVALLLLVSSQLCLVATVNAQAGTSITRIVQISLTGGLPDCTQCGAAGKYACSNGIGKWNDGKFSFVDPLNATEAGRYYLTAVTARVDGNFGCDQTAAGFTDMKLFVAGTLLQVVRTTNDGNYCACGRCNTLTLYGQYIAGYPKYSLTNENSVEIHTLKNYACISLITLTLTYYPRPNQNTLYTTVGDFKTTQPKESAYCGNYDQYTCSNQDSQLWASNTSLSVKLFDPLPFNSILYMVNVTAYGFFGCSAGSSSSFIISTSLQGILINQNTLYGTSSCNTGSSNILCSAPLTFKAKNGFPAGWPGYKYSDTNIFKFELGNAYYASCVSRFDFVYLYYTKGSNQLKTARISTAK